MPDTPNLEIPHIVEAQNQKEVTANESADLFDSAIAGHDTIDFPSETTLTPAKATMLASMAFKVTSTATHTTQQDVVVPVNTKMYFFDNQVTGTAAIRIKTSAGAGIVIADDRGALVFCDGTNVIRFGPDVDVDA